MIYEIRAGGRTFYTADTEQLADTGVYYGNSNLIVRERFDYYQGDYNSYVFPVSRTVYYRASNSSTYQYLTITSVTPLYDQYYASGMSGAFDGSMLSFIMLGVIAVCCLFRIFFRR